MERGIVVGPKIRQAQGFNFHGGLSLEDVSKWLLYWDKIVYAGISIEGGFLSGRHSPHIQYLESCNIFRTEFVDISIDELPPEKEGNMKFMGISENQLSEANTLARVKLTERLSNTANEIWALGQSGGENLILPGDNRMELIDISLANCLPVPNSLTSFDEILKFKSRYSNELENLRCSLDTLREKVASSADQQRALKIAIKDLQEAMLNIGKALKGCNIDSTFESISLYSHNPAIGFWTALAALASGVALTQGQPNEVAVAIQTLGIAVPTVIKFAERTVVGGNRLPNSQKDFAYAYHVTHQLR